LEEQQRLVSVLVSREGDIEIQGLPLDDLLNMLEMIKDFEVKIEAEPCPSIAHKGKKQDSNQIHCNIITSNCK
jgi:hypothetical protein